MLPLDMGTRYAEVVETCLTCLDEGNADFGDEAEFQDRDGILVAVRYIEKVCFVHREVSTKPVPFINWLLTLDPQVLSKLNDINV